MSEDDVQLAPSEWRTIEQAHATRADAFTADHRRRAATGERHPIDDFLYDYYGTKPRLVRRWHPGARIILLPDNGTPAPHHAWRWYKTTADGAVRFDAPAFIAVRRDSVQYIHTLLNATASRPPSTACFGLHEWAMVYRQEAHRHPLPLRLGQDATDAVVERHQIRCTHYDAFRFFTPEAVGRNRLQPTRSTQPQLEQPGCLHVGMDLWKWVSKLGPAVPGDLALDCFQLAREIRTLDMQASPYDVTPLGERAVKIETADGKAEYVTRQRTFASKAAVLRSRLANVCQSLLQET
ncbi:hypothetical protein [Georgenia sp. SUBG003]|uniref:hypothetical protein n=1 Tax=Georgenia sp. SUBG003 TaxID=1497974 RepID=UPI0004D845DA|nr:3-methyladenine DNA glycosylase [Georgenia sp. SUBG003]